MKEKEGYEKLVEERRQEWGEKRRAEVKDGKKLGNEKEKGKLDEGSRERNGKGRAERGKWER